MPKNNDEALEGLQHALITTLGARLKDKQCDAATLNVARQLLKDHNFQLGKPEEDKGLQAIDAGLLPFTSPDDPQIAPKKKRAS